VVFIRMLLAIRLEFHFGYPSRFQFFCS